MPAPVPSVDMEGDSRAPLPDAKGEKSSDDIAPKTVYSRYNQRGSLYPKCHLADSMGANEVDDLSRPIAKYRGLTESTRSGPAAGTLAVPADILT